jgi:flagellar hook-associated protein 3 FlgL
MAIRTTQHAVAAEFLAQTQAVYARMAKTQNQLETGLAISRPSDDPFGTGQVISYDAELADVKRYQANVSSSMDFMATEDTALGSITSALQQISVLAKSAQGTKNAADLQTVAQQIAQLKETVRDGANAQFGNQYIFGGTSTLAQPYPLPGNGYTGTTNTMQSRIGANQSVTINADGESVFGAAGPPAPGNVFDVIDQLVLDVQSGNVTNINATTQNLSVATDRVIDVRTQLGATAARLETMRDRLAATEERVQSSRSQIAEVDPTEAFLRFNQQQTAYQAALASGTRMLQTSILDFLH